MPAHCRPLARRLAALAAAMITQSAMAAPVSVHDDSGRRVTLPAPARRVVSLAPHATELLYAAGGGPAMVGADRYSDYPPAALGLPRVGDGLQPDAERILALEPDLLVLWTYDGRPPTGLPLAMLEQFGVTLFRSNPQRLADIPGTIDRLGTLLGTENAAHPLAAQLRRRLAALQGRYRDAPPVRVFYQLGQGPMYTVSDRGIIGDALRLCGAVNVFGALPAAAPMVSVEGVLRADPQVIILAQSGPAADAILARWQTLDPALAAKPGHLLRVDPDTMNRAGPRMIEATEEMCGMIDRARQAR